MNIEAEIKRLGAPGRYMDDSEALALIGAPAMEVGTFARPCGIERIVSQESPCGLEGEEDGQV